jgi:hypothetical protein
MTNPLVDEAEFGVCKHCRGQIIRWPGMVPWGDKWVHNPRKGFRYHHCDGHTSIAEPS